MVDQVATIPNYALVEYVNMPETITQTIFLLLNTQTIPGNTENIRIIESNELIDEFIDEEDFKLQNNNEKVKIKMNITKVSKYVPILDIDDIDEMEE